ncbi:lytic transglycosylase domain-containing protein [Methylobacterium soli]|uniref:Lytic transglycosylase domain-containing protein n=1 Tax=Methylobacterium soli TaxID=553447 RepID=A0A6L3SW30_9HYPH|nr:lytic transglycosylase domain-containing protein [Methylobacterium soli]KAB1075944.1 lytic transglycosylase domain-containing protein [Methylobacterium soli]GJE46132.1 hypothetical protein AEGHOMDF_5332 [Methylobacterium soli]
MSIKIPVTAELNQQDVQAQIKQMEAALNDLGRVAQDAGRLRFTPVTKTTLDDIKRMRAEFDAMVRMAPGLKRALEAGGQAGRSFDQVEWGKVWHDPAQRAGHAHSMLSRLRPDSVDTRAAQQQPSGGSGSNTPGRHRDPDGGNRPPSIQRRGWKMAAGSAAAGIAGGVASQVGGLTGGVASGALAGGFVGGGIGAAIGGLAGALTSVIGSLGEARDAAISLDTLKRTLGDTNISFQRLSDKTHSLADEFSLKDDEAIALTSSYAKLSGSNNQNGLRDEVGVGVGFSRSFGLDPSAGVNFFGQMRGMGITRSADDNKRLALLIGESVAKAGELPRMADVMAGLGRYIESTSTRAMSGGNSEAWLSKLAGLSQTGLPGTSPGASSNMLAKVDNAVSQGGITEAGKNFMSGTLQKALGLNAVQAEMQLEGGMFASGRSTFGPNTAIGRDYQKHGVPLPEAANSDRTNMELLMEAMEREYAGKPRELMLNAMKTQFGLSYGQAAAWENAGSVKVGGLVSRLTRLGVDPSQVNSTGISQLSQLEADNKLTDAQKDAAAKDIAGKNQEDTVGSDARKATIDGSNAMVRLAADGLPMLSSIQSGVLKLAGMDAPSTPEQRAREADHQARLGSIESDLGKKKDAAWKEYSDKVPFWKRGATAFQSSEEDALGKKYWDAKQAYDDAVAGEGQRYKKDSLDNVPAGVPELHPVQRDVVTSGANPAGTGSTSSKPLDVGKQRETMRSYLEAHPDLAARLEREDEALGHEKGTAAAQLWQESRFKSGAVSNQGALGFAQMMPENVAAMSKRAGRNLDPSNLDDALLMRRMLMQDNQANPNIGHNLDRELMAYYGGASGKAWGPKTRQYPADVKRWMGSVPDADQVPAIEQRKREQEAARRDQGISVNVHQTGEFILRDSSGNQVAQADLQTTVGKPVASGTTSAWR